MSIPQSKYSYKYTVGLFHVKFGNITDFEVKTLSKLFA